ncbi:MAG: TonB-dependent receptor [Bacteroidales bacterium]|nr:TonB-dependent receptor [Bacteroidales bacterium]
MKKTISIFICLCCSLLALSQNGATIYGTVSDSLGLPVQLANVGVVNLSKPIGCVSNESGQYSLDVPANKELKVVVSFVGYGSIERILTLKKGEKRKVDFTLASSSTLLQAVEITSDNSREEGFTRVSAEWAKHTAGPTGGVEGLLKSLEGVSSNNELSSQYNVRGGNFDENLVYVNDIEVYRPFLVRSAQQEGLSFINSDMVSDITFSSGGFDAKYGDKMSSVLDIKYRKPVEFAASASVGLLGASLHVEQMIGSKFTYQLGFRNKNTKHLISTTDTEGDYFPSFNDLQLYATYDVSEKIEIALLGNIAYNTYNFIPENRETSFGNLYEMLKLKIYFDGQELDCFSSMFGALALTYKPKIDLQLKFIASAFSTDETVNYDIQGQYWLSETGLGYEDEQGLERGIGTYIEHARNHLEASIFNFEHKGYKTLESGKLSWGAKIQGELIYDKVNEWKMVDSAGYTIPSSLGIVGVYDSVVAPSLQNTFKSNNDMTSTRLTAYLQRDWNKTTSWGRWFANVGARVMYWSFNNEVFFSPRAGISFSPAKNPNLLFRLAGGIYAQSPFYKELRNEQGEINPDIRSQKSWHTVLSSDWTFEMLDRPFKLMTSVYYKYLWDLIPYRVDNVQLRYSAQNNSVGYACGTDIRLYGEFIKGIDSWITLSLMKTEEDIEGDGAGYIPRPTDQLYNINISFQDYVPKMPYLRVYLSFNYGSGYPYGAPNSQRYLQTNRMPDYLRCDIAFTFRIKDENSSWAKNNFMKVFKRIWFNVEWFNVFSSQNVISYFWVADYSNKYYGVPNYLTPSQINAKLTLEF